MDEHHGKIHLELPVTVEGKYQINLTNTAVNNNVVL